VGIVDRYDLIFLKLFAAADAADSRSVHFQDLIALNPSAVELSAAGRWVKSQDASHEFPPIVDRVISAARGRLELE
jgi:hypothetical protein